MPTKEKGKTISKPNRKIEQFCSVCKKTFQMPVVEEGDAHDVIWLKCPGCDGFLPFMVEGADSGAPGGGAKGEDGSGINDLALEDIDTDSASEYIESGEYTVGDIVYHRSWNDYGRVISKETLPGDRKTIIVQFVNQGKTRLLEGVAP